MAKQVTPPDSYEYERHLHEILADCVFNINVYGKPAADQITEAIRRIKNLDQNFGHYLDAKYDTDIPEYDPNEEPDLSEVPF